MSSRSVQLVTEQILSSVGFRASLEGIAARGGRQLEDVAAEARSCLEEVATVQSPLAVDVFRTLTRPMHSRAWDVQVDSNGLERLKELNRRHALIFLPSHRSYVDPLVLAGVFEDHDLPSTHVIGGDNMGFWPFGAIGKRAGIVFIRRSFGSDDVYKLAVREFLGHLIAERLNLEWYFEGGRSRTGKLRPPKYGLMRYIADAVENGKAEDVILVPVSIAYDRQAEVVDITSEQTGAKKRREGLAWMFDYIRAQSRNAGTAHVHFGEPLSLRGALAEAGDGPARLEKVAFRVCEGINRVTPVTATSIVTLALLGSRDRALTLEQVARVTEPLLDYCERRGLPGPIAELRAAGALRAALDSLVEGGAARAYEGGTEPVWSIAPGGHHAAAFYRNGALHHLVNRAIVELALLRLAQSAHADQPLDVAWRDALALRDLLKFEFFFADKRRFREELAEELALLDPAWAQRVDSPESAAELLRASGMLVAHRALRSFLDAQWIVAGQLRGRPAPADREAFLERCVGIGRQYVLQGRVHGEESVSRDLFKAALQLAENRDGLDEAELEDVIARLQTIAVLDAETLEGVLAR